MKKTYRRPNIYKISLGNECLVPVILSKQSIGNYVEPIGNNGNPEGNVDDEADANIYHPSLWDEE